MSLKYDTFQVVSHQLSAKISKPIEVVPFGDVHRDSHNCDEKAWKRWLKDAKERHTPQTLYIGMGDYNDFASWSERKKLKGQLHESTAQKLDDVAAADIAKFCDEISFMKGSLLGFIQGNHEWEFQDGELGTEKMAAIMGTNFLGYACYVTVAATLSSNTRKGSFDIFASHGKGGGRLLGSPYNKVEQMSDIFPDADLYLMGHDHNRGAISKTHLRISKFNNEVEERLQWFGRTGSFLRGFVPDTPSYVVSALYSPTSIGGIRFAVKYSLNKCGAKGERRLKRTIKLEA